MNNKDYVVCSVLLNPLAVRYGAALPKNLVFMAERLTEGMYRTDVRPIDDHLTSISVVLDGMTSDLDTYMNPSFMSPFEPSCHSNHRSAGVLSITTSQILQISPLDLLISFEPLRDGPIIFYLDSDSVESVDAYLERNHDKQD